MNDDIRVVSVGEVGPAGAVASDGDKGDIAVSLGGTAWTINPGVVTNATLSNMPANTVKMNNTGVLASAIDVTLAQFKTWLSLTLIDIMNALGFAPANVSHTHGTVEIDNDAVTNAKLANMAANTLKGNNTGLSADPLDLTVAQTKTLLAYSVGDIGAQPSDATLSALAGLDASAGLIEQSGADAFVKRSLGVGTAAAVPTRADADVRYAASAHSHGTAGIDDGAVTFPKFRDIATDRLIGRDSASSGDVEEIALDDTLEFTGTGAIQRAALTGDIAAVAGSNATVIQNDAVSYAKLQNVSASRLLGRATASPGDAEEIVLGTNLSFTGTTLHAAGGGGGVTDGDKGDITVSGSGATWTVDVDAITYSKIQNVSAADKVLGRFTGGPGDIEEIVCTAAGRALIDDANAAAQRTTLSLGALATKTTIATADIDDYAITDEKLAPSTFAVLRTTTAYLYGGL